MASRCSQLSGSVVARRQLSRSGGVVPAIQWIRWCLHMPPDQPAHSPRQTTAVWRKGKKVTSTVVGAGERGTKRGVRMVHKACPVRSMRLCEKAQTATFGRRGDMTVFGGAWGKRRWQTRSPHFQSRLCLTLSYTLWVRSL
eukprot:354617-Chlamydomonas_euryale.AAC.2